jgi:hypothetical protein
MAWVVPLLVVVGVGGAFAVASELRGRLRIAALVAVLGALLIAPASWAFDTLGHATSSTFPAGGPASAAFGGGPGGAGGRFGGAPPTGAFGAGTAGGANGGAQAGGTAGGFPGGGATGGGTAGGMFGGDTSELSAALAYARSHGGGTIAVSSQSGAAGAIIQSGASVAGIGGFSGRESDVTVSWLTQEVRDGHIRWVIASSGGFGGFGGSRRTGSQIAMSAVQQSCKQVSSVSGLYDCRGAF